MKTNQPRRSELLKRITAQEGLSPRHLYPVMWKVSGIWRQTEERKISERFSPDMTLAQITDVLRERKISMWKMPLENGPGHAIFFLGDEADARLARVYELLVR